MTNNVCYNSIKHTQLQADGSTLPSGWFVKTIKSEENGALVSATLGVYVDADKFIAVPIHFDVIPSLVLVGSPEGSPSNIAYYMVPSQLELRMIKSRINSGKNKGKVIPMLVPARENQKADFLTCIAIRSDRGESIIDASTSATMVRSFITKDRHLFAGIFIGDREVDVPGIVFTMTSAVLGSNDLKTSTIQLSAMRDQSTVTDVATTIEKIEKTKFVDFENKFLTTRYKKYTPKK